MINCPFLNHMLDESALGFDDSQVLIFLHQKLNITIDDIWIPCQVILIKHFLK